jgi:hypothetical protein
LAVDCHERVIQRSQFNDGISGDVRQLLKIFQAKTDRTPAAVFCKNRQTVGPADNGAGSVHAAGTFFKQRTGTEAVRLPGFLPDVTHHFGREFLQCGGKRYGLDRKNRNVDPAAIAGTPFCAGNMLWVPLPDVVTDPVNFDNQILIISERLQGVPPNPDKPGLKIDDLRK